MALSTRWSLTGVLFVGEGGGGLRGARQAAAPSSPLSHFHERTSRAPTWQRTLGAHMTLFLEPALEREVLSRRKSAPSLLSLYPLSCALMTLKSLLFLLSQFGFHGNWSGGVITLLRILKTDVINKSSEGARRLQGRCLGTDAQEALCCLGQVSCSPTAPPACVPAISTERVTDACAGQTCPLHGVLTSSVLSTF
ncbi:hypothetical protein CB1_000568032 [Camelus ferus]|nr:hypothetical protein CB1_000568032 [Camelus ferus]